MKSSKWLRLSLKIYLWLVVSLFGIISGVFQPRQVLASEKQQDTVNNRIKTPSETHSFSTRVESLLSQSPTPDTQLTVLITGVKANPTNKGVEVILETVQGEQLQITNRSDGNSFIADIPNAQLRLLSGETFTFRSEKPMAGITEITVTNIDANSVRLMVVGEKILPTVELFDGDEGLIFAIAPTTTATQPSQPANQTAQEEPPVQQDEAIELIVTGEQDQYFAPNATTATRTDTPILKIPQSIQVIPRQVLEEQQVTRLEEALQNSSSVVYNGTDTFSDLNYSIRGFNQAPVLQNGFRQYDFAEIPEVANIERIEVLKGPASILYGEIQPGGLINVVTKKPLSEPFYQGELQFGSDGLIRPQIDISGPLTDDKSLLYRLNAVYSRRDGFRDFDQEFKQFFIAPALTWKISDRTNLAFDLQVSNREQPWDSGTLAFENGVIDTPRSRIFNEPDDFLRRDFLSLNLSLDHKFSDNWSIRNAFRFTDSTVFSDQLSIFLGFDETNGELQRIFALDDFNSRNYSLQTNVVGKFTTGALKHTLLFGADLSRTNTSRFALANFTSFPINVFNPTYGVNRPDFDTLLFDRNSEIDRLGIYLQNQIEIFDQLNILLGLRYETVAQRNENVPALFYPGGDTTQNDSAWTPRVGIVYQPIPHVSLYGSYSQSFNPSVDDIDADGNPLEPELGEGFELGVKTELLNGNLLATLAYFDVTKQNVATEDPNFSGFGISIATGEQRSQGVELDLTGKISPGWNIIASYSYTDATVTRDNTIAVGNRLTGIPQHKASLWTTYEIQSGSLQGLGGGIGINYVGERPGDLDNSFTLDSYFLTNAALFYRRDNWKFALNFRNLFDVEYTNSRGGFGSRTNAGLPGEPFTVVGSISVSF
ncbi:TonB-dependent siderophore receptor [Anabaena cylindrica FACHB-243]|uniref:TonB-dependent siderophore receptor n=1 Tax=Anabaena cylindrica (strain ATCC 27899 / PCC 7122) TaxID=272123 RepID=K9ZMT2_ANACC|nr:MULTISPECIES: TonB-dependent siderophore receptor [Anabaena]AFZ59625.1 TonB-dependent siderophore receptor [Anabaena cylindrica PCC 7122]MBD2418712.1 TonB-dependent siderophore receptor [Anabaena cylindrica FACHB-243]MBY5281661.1 TonB-dependent siderophore receptor [Anabaena sp. CCAP 1446/1C]MBY5309187.1 TonB-dependent siderophore receptor [Anabaena sp. CCAP 1446/1C]MCM2406275.1 TonB-dependent siderophore receptor [Anabaena sp. CCAP 1446/1C]